MRGLKPNWLLDVTKYLLKISKIQCSNTFDRIGLSVMPRKEEIGCAARVDSFFGIGIVIPRPKSAGTWLYFSIKLKILANI